MAGDQEVQDPAVAPQTATPATAATAAATNERQTGTVKFFSTKGYGFIVQPDNTEIFVHSKEIKGIYEFCSKHDKNLQLFERTSKA